MCLLWDVSRINPDRTNRGEQVAIAEKAEEFISNLEYFLGSSSDKLKEKAFYQLSDTLILFNRSYAGTALRSLSCPPRPELVQKLKEYFNLQLASLEDTGSAQSLRGEDEEEDEGHDRENLVVFEKKRLIAAMGKMVAANVFPERIPEHASDILVHFVVRA